MNKSTVLPRVHTWALPVFLLLRIGTGVETRQTFHRGHAASIKTTRLLRKDCLAGYRLDQRARRLLLVTTVSTYTSEITQQRHHFAHLP